MTKKTEEKEDTLEELEDMLDKLRPTIDDFMNNRIRHFPFAKAIVWLHTQALMGQDIIYSADLAKKTGTSRVAANNKLYDFANIGIFKTVKNSTFNEYHFTAKGKQIIKDWTLKAKKTLGLA